MSQPAPSHQVVSRFAVRSYEIDSYRHLNNGVYASWLEQGRLDWLLALGFSYDSLADRKQWFVVARAELDFRASLQLGDQVDLTTVLEGWGRTSCRFRQMMARAPGHARAGELACEGLTIMVVTGPDGPIPLPEDLLAAAAAGGPLA